MRKATPTAAVGLTITCLAGSIAVSPAVAAPESPSIAPAAKRACSSSYSPVTIKNSSAVGTTVAKVSAGKNGALTWSATVNGADVVRPSALGLEREDADFTSGLRLCSVSKPRKVAENYRLTQSKVSKVRGRATERDLTFAGRTGERMIVTVRAWGNGAAVRYAFPQLPTAKRVEVTKDATSFAIPTSANDQQIALPQTEKNPKNQEFYLPAGTDRAVNKLGTSNKTGWSFPLTARTTLNKVPWWLYVGESDLHGQYPATHLDGNVTTTKDAANFQVQFPTDESNAADGEGNARISGPGWTSPWRFVVASRNMQDIAATTATTDLARDAAKRDWSWVKPGSASFSWASGADTLKTWQAFAPFLDLSKKMGWDYAVADAGWDQMVDDKGEIVGVDQLAAEARERGLGLWVWVNSGGPNNKNVGTPRDVIVDRTERRAYFKKLQRAGVVGVKVDIWESDKQDLLARQREVLEDAADAKLMVALHNTTVSRGMEREFPHLLSVEGAVGGTYQTSSLTNVSRIPENDTFIAFNRIVSGPLDYTPGVLNPNQNDKFARFSTNAYQLALGVVMQSGLISYGAAPEYYLNQPADVRHLLRTLPGSYDEVRHLNGVPGDHAVIARRKGKTWYVAGINGKTISTATSNTVGDPGHTKPEGVAQTLTADLHSLGCKPKSQVKLIADGKDKTSYTIEDRALGKDQVLSVDTAEFGGFVATVTGCRK